MANTFEHSVVGRTFGPLTYAYDWQKPALFALGCGAGTDELELLLETRGPKVLPAFAAVVATEPLNQAMEALQGNLLMRLHAAQKMVFHRPIPSQGSLSTTASVRKIYDQGKGALVVFDTFTKGEDGEPLFDTEMQVFYRAHGGFGGEKSPEPESLTPPDRAPDAAVEMKTAPTQAILYRFGSQDLNPIHSDPAISKKVGLPRPILHGLCTFGFATRAAIQALCGGDPEKLRSIEGRFSKPVYPGETLLTELWNAGGGEARYVTRSKERGEAVLDLGRVTFSA